MSKIDLITAKTLDLSFKNFTKRTLENNFVSKAQIIGRLSAYESKYHANGLYKSFFCNAENFAYCLEKSNMLDLAGIAFSKLAKLPAPYEVKERVLRRGLKVARKQNDPIHILARIVDLKKLYEASDESYKHLTMLLQEEQELYSIVNNFPSAIRHFKTISREPSSRDIYLYRLAQTTLEISKHVRPKDAFPRLLDAQDIFTELGCYKELGYVRKLLSEY